MDPNRIAARIVVQFRSAVANLADNLMTSTEQRKKIQRLKNRLLEDPEVGAWIASAWESIGWGNGTGSMSPNYALN